MSIISLPRPIEEQITACFDEIKNNQGSGIDHLAIIHLSSNGELQVKWGWKAIWWGIIDGIVNIFHGTDEKIITIFNTFVSRAQNGNKKIANEQWENYVKFKCLITNHVWSANEQWMIEHNETFSYNWNKVLREE